VAWCGRGRAYGSLTAALSTCAGPARAAWPRLRLDRIDLYKFHRPDPKVAVAESIGALAELKDEGKIRHIGVSNFSEEQLREAERVAPVVSVQNRYNATDRSSEAMADLCEQEMLVFLPWAPIVEADASSRSSMPPGATA
jgi:pyridoxine 4-dehydrogenase